MTINDIAILAKVSTGTVDRVIHNRGGVSKKTEKIINNLIRKIKDKNLRNSLNSKKGLKGMEMNNQ